MAFISYALTKDEYMAGIKTATRRFWKDKHLENWQRWFDEGKRLHDGWDKVPFAGGKKLAPFYLTKRPYRQPLSEMTWKDLIAEGGMCQTRAEFFDLVGHPPEAVPVVVEFVLVLAVLPCPACNGRWVHCVDRTGLSGVEEFERYYHLDKHGIHCLPDEGSSCLAFGSGLAGIPQGTAVGGKLS